MSERAPPFIDHPLLHGLRIIRPPRGLALRVVEALCKDRGLPTTAAPDWDPGLPTDEVIATELGIGLPTLRTLIHQVARDIMADSQDIEMIPPKPRIFIWYRHQLWQKQSERRTA